MALEYIIGQNGVFYNSHNGEVFRSLYEERKARLEKENGLTVIRYDSCPVLGCDKALSRYAKKHSISFFPYPVSDNKCYEYDTVAEGDTVTLVIYEGSYNARMVWTPVYYAAASPGNKMSESGSHNIAYWFDYFATNYGHDRVKYSNISKFEHNQDTMRRVRKVFSCDLSENALLFFYRFSKTKKYRVLRYPSEWFCDIPYPRINRRIGKSYDSIRFGGEIIHYAWQSEVMIHDIPFLDVVVLSGYVEDGVIDVMEKHRFFLAEDFAYSPDGGDFGVFAQQFFFGKVNTTQLRKHPNRLMLDQYSGKNVYKYMFCKHFVPAFEILAKAGCSEIADALLERYYSDYRETHCSKWLVDYYGNNDDEILRFKIKYLKQLPDAVIRRYSNPKGLRILFMCIRTILWINPSLFKSITDVNLFLFASLDQNPGNLYEKIEYLKRIGTEYYSIYLDYLRLCYGCGRYADGQGPYPRNLRLAHDTMVAYKGEVTAAKHDSAFSEVVSNEDYTEKVFIPDDEKYCILAPRTADDLVYESYTLSHCVRGYIHAVSKGYTSIYFLRLKNKRSTPLVTIEVRHGQIIQTRGKCNRPVTSEELLFIKKWAEAVNLDSSSLTA